MTSPIGASGAAAPTRLDAPWLTDPDIRAVLDALSARGATPRFVGGCVRNALIGADVSDLDIALDRPPDETTALLEAAGLKAIPTGVEHGTVTALSPTRREPIEITSLRRDVATDGRRAVVAFTRDWAEDARRRDFTMNALYAERDGAVVDPLGGGLADLDARRVRFIGRAADRIREDALRILRFFRFTAWYGAPEDAAPQDVADIAALTGLIGGLARERIGQETRKLLSAPDPAAALGMMAETGALAASLAPHAPGQDSLAQDSPAQDSLAQDSLAQDSPAAIEAAMSALVRAEAALDAPPDPLVRLAALSAAPPGALAERLRLSRPETRALERLCAAAALIRDGGAAGAAGQRFGLEAARGALLVTAADDPARHEALPDAARAAEAGAAATFPVAAADLIAAGLAPGPALGAALARLRGEWIDSGFALDKDALIARLSTIRS